MRDRQPDETCAQVRPIDALRQNARSESARRLEGGEDGAIDRVVSGPVGAADEQYDDAYAIAGRLRARVRRADPVTVRRARTHETVVVHDGLVRMKSTVMHGDRGTDRRTCSSARLVTHRARHAFVLRRGRRSPHAALPRPGMCGPSQPCSK